MGFTGAEQYAVGHDAGTSATRLQRAHKLGKEQQFCLAGVGVGEYLLVDITLVEAACKRRICHNEGVAALVFVLLGQRVAPSKFRSCDVVQQEVHGANAQHGLVGVVAVNHGGLYVMHLVAYKHGSLVVLLDVLDCLYKEAC